MQVWCLNYTSKSRNLSVLVNSSPDIFSYSDRALICIFLSRELVDIALSVLAHQQRLGVASLTV